MKTTEWEGTWTPKDNNMKLNNRMAPRESRTCHCEQCDSHDYCSICEKRLFAHEFDDGNGNHFACVKNCAHCIDGKIKSAGDQCDCPCH